MATDTTLRNIALLQAIPVHPQRKSTRQIKDELTDLDSGFDVTVRSVQRSLENLSSTFPITSETRGRANHWFWIDRHALTQIPAMGEPTAFVLRLAAEYLKPAMPPSVLRRLDAYFEHADRVLGGTALGRWQDKAMIIHQGPQLRPPAIPDDVQETVYTALLDGRRFEAAYRSKAQTRTATLELNPLGIVVRAGIVYLVATSWGYEDIRHYALHRMRKPKLLTAPANVPAGFRLAEHVDEDVRFSYPLSNAKLAFKALLDAGAAIHLAESRLAADQRTTEQADGRMLVEATVADTADLRWWLLSFGAAVEVIAPDSLREEFAGQARRLAEIYK